MSLRIANNRCSYISRNILKFAKYYSSNALALEDKQKGQQLISCKRKKLDHYTNVFYNKFDEVPLASKGWEHSKAKGDYFVVHPLRDKCDHGYYSFEECDVNEKFIDAMRSQGINRLTDFQYQATKTLESGEHCMLAAETGCGKTISYLLPILHKIVSNGRTHVMNSPKAVIVVPNRELAYQVGEMANTLCQAVDVTTKVVVGGRTKQAMLHPTFEDIDILVATPGALSKLSTVGIYKLNDVQFLVMDEADTLLDDSFIEKMSTIIKRAPQSQKILVSATLPKKLPDILTSVGQVLKKVTSLKLHKPILNITQKFLRLNKSDKPSHLLQIAKSNKDPMVVFTNRNQTCNWLAMFLRENGVQCANINGNMNYAVRIDQWNQFIRGEAKVLSATDVGSRGLNTIQVKHVLNYDFPLYAADYLHRIGRVGRLGGAPTCKATNFICGAAEIKLVQQIELAIRTDQPLQNVDANITNIVQNKILKNIREAA